jgi:DNA-binding transcriptional ArsR family regulator
MRHGGYLVQAYKQPTWRALFSLPVNIGTAMLLLDCVARGEITSTLWPSAVLPRLSAQALKHLQAMRAILAHGAVLRSFFLRYLPSASPAQYDWSALRDWLEHLAQADIEQLIGHGIRANLEFCRLYPQIPHVPEQDLLLAQLDADAALLEDKTFRRSAIQAILDGWEIERHGPVSDLVERRAPALALVEHPARLQAAMLEFLQELWQQGFAEEWERRKHMLAAATESAQVWLEQEASACLPDEVVLRVTGLQLPEEWLPMLRRASTVVFVPCLLLDKYLSLSSEQDTLYIIYDPGSVVNNAKQDASPPALGLTILDHTSNQETQEKRAAASYIAENEQEYFATSQALDLETLGPAIRILGDTTSLMILMLLAEHGEMFAQQVAEKLHVHQSTTSRHFTQLERAGLVSVRPEGGMKFYSANRQLIKEICYLLLKTFA